MLRQDAAQIQAYLDVLAAHVQDQIVKHEATKTTLAAALHEITDTIADLQSTNSEIAALQEALKNDEKAVELFMRRESAPRLHEYGATRRFVA